MSDALERIEKAHTVVSDLCHRRTQWVMRVPADEDRDPDLVIGGALRAAKNHIKDLESKVKALQRDKEKWKTRAHKQGTSEDLMRWIQEARNAPSVPEKTPHCVCLHCFEALSRNTDRGRVKTLCQKCVDQGWSVEFNWTDPNKPEKGEG